MLVGSNHRAIDKQDFDGFQDLLGKFLKKCLPDTDVFPAAETVVHGIPISKAKRQIAPRDAGSRSVQDRFHEVAIREFRRCPSRRFDILDDGLERLPDFVREQQANVVHDVSPVRGTSDPEKRKQQ